MSETLRRDHEDGAHDIGAAKGCPCCPQARPDDLAAVRAEGRRRWAEAKATHQPWSVTRTAEDEMMWDWFCDHADALLADPAPEGLSQGERPEDYEPRIYGEGVANPGEFWPYTLNAVGPARVVFDVLHPDRDGGWGFALKQADEQAVAIAEALADAGYIDRLSTPTEEGPNA